MSDNSGASRRLIPVAIWVVVPTLNEANNIEVLLGGIRDATQGLRCGVCIVDGGSVDGTTEKVERFATGEDTEFTVRLVSQAKLHYGAQRGGAVVIGLRYGLQHPKWDVFVEMDGDSAHSPHELMEGIQAITDRGYNVAIASKYLAGSRVTGRSTLRRLLSSVYNAYLRAFLSHQIHDFSNGYRFYDEKSARLLCSQRIRYTSPVYLVEALALLIASGSKVTEFPSLYRERRSGASKLTIVDIVKAGVGVSEITIRHWVETARKVNYNERTF